jgi:hypothetical protein
LGVQQAFEKHTSGPVQMPLQSIVSPQPSLSAAPH